MHYPYTDIVTLEEYYAMRPIEPGVYKYAHELPTAGLPGFEADYIVVLAHNISAESHYGHMINHSPCESCCNLTEKVELINGRPQLMFGAKREIRKGDQLLKNYGECYVWPDNQVECPTCGTVEKTGPKVYKNINRKVMVKVMAQGEQGFFIQKPPPLLKRSDAVLGREQFDTHIRKHEVCKTWTLILKFYFYFCHFSFSKPLFRLKLLGQIQAFSRKKTCPSFVPNIHMKTGEGKSTTAFWPRRFPPPPPRIRGQVSMSATNWVFLGRNDN